mmetsp:Transcript_26611/g.58313  ORF Transcript_26611/g.58313 Transcript_26611/m.58313 type:complete len:219 (+) Transcript_26611:1032-1688(+)
MSHLASFLRDSAVQELNEEVEQLRDENQRLRAELEHTWAISITGPGGSPEYATQTLSFRSVLFEFDENSLSVGAKVLMQEGGTACNLGQLLESEIWVRVSSNGTRSNHVQSVTSHRLEIESVGYANGRLTTTSWFEQGGDLIDGFCFSVAVPLGLLNRLDPNLTEGSSDQYYPFTMQELREVAGDCQARLDRLILRTSSLFDLLDGTALDGESLLTSL